MSKKTTIETYCEECESLIAPNDIAIRDGRASFPVKGKNLCLIAQIEMSSPKNDGPAKHSAPADICLDCFMRLLGGQVLIHHRTIRQKDLPTRVRAMHDEGMSFVQIARALGRSQNTVRAAFHRTGAYSKYRPKKESSDAPIVAEDA